MIIKAADESIDREMPRMDSEYSMGYQLTMELLKEAESLPRLQDRMI